VRVLPQESPGRGGSLPVLASSQFCRSGAVMKPGSLLPLCMREVLDVLDVGVSPAHRLQACRFMQDSLAGSPGKREKNAEPLPD